MIYDVKSVADRVQHEVDLLREWFRRDYPESDLRAVCEFNGILFTLKITIEVLMGKEVTEDLTGNRGFFRARPIFLTEKDLRDPGFMEEFYRVFNPEIRRLIQGSFNRHYLQQKIEAGKD